MIVKVNIIIYFIIQIQIYEVNYCHCLFMGVNLYKYNIDTIGRYFRNLHLIIVIVNFFDRHSFENI